LRKEIIMRFFPENSMFTVFDSYIQQTPSSYMVLALETTTITFINKLTWTNFAKNIILLKLFSEN